MKKVKNYVDQELAKKKVARYKYWSIKDETGVTITSSEDAQDGRSFADLLDKIIGDNVDAEIQVKFGTNEQSSRQNTPIFIRINETIEWIEPEEDETIKINGVPHKLDKTGNVNINLQPPNVETPTIEMPNDGFRQEFEMQLEGLRKENELIQQRSQQELHNRLAEQTLKFKEMMLEERESRIREREESLTQQESIFEEKQREMKDTIKGYAKHVPSVLGGLVKDWLKPSKVSIVESSLGETKKPRKERTPVSFEIEDQEPQTEIIEHSESIENDFDTSILDVSDESIEQEN